MSFYLVRVGAGSKYAVEAHKEGFVAIGWKELPDLRTLKSLNKVKKALSAVDYGYSAAQLAAQAGQVFRFANEMKEGDTILMPVGGGEYLVGTLGEYYYEQNPRGICPYVHRRHVEWLDRRLSKDDMSTNLTYSVGAIMTIFSLVKYEHELKALIAGEPWTPADKPQRVRDVVLDGLMEFDGQQFEEFTRHILEIVGFTAQTTQYVGDKGIDVNGILQAEGLAEITLRVQAKRVHATIGNDKILALRGALGQGEHGCFITLSSFTQSAIEEAQAPGKTSIKLIDGNDLAGLVLKHFDELDEQYKGHFRVRRKRDFNIEDQFEQDMALLDEDDEIAETETISGDSPDTIVCPAKEDGFKSAFLDQQSWWAVRISSTKRDQLKYLAIYRVAPISKITHYGKIDRIEPYGNTGKYRIYLDGPAVKLERPIGSEGERSLHLQSSRYTQIEKLLKAGSLEELFDKGE